MKNLARALKNLRQETFLNRTRKQNIGLIWLCASITALVGISGPIWLEVLLFSNFIASAVHYTE